jgi:hypothetical protein
MDRASRFLIRRDKPDVALSTRLRDEKNQQRRDDRKRLVENNRNLEATNETFTVKKAPPKGRPMTKLLELWRKEKEEKLKMEKANRKPVFKVTTASNNPAGKTATTTRTLSRATSLTAVAAPCPRPVTRSFSKKGKHSGDRQPAAARDPS